MPLDNVLDTGAIPDVAPAAPEAAPIVAEAAQTPPVAPEPAPAETPEVTLPEPSPTPAAEPGSLVEGAEEPPKPEEPAPAEPEPPPTYEAFKLPEGIAPSEEAMGEYTAVLGEYRLPQEAGQRLLDLHAKTLADAQTAMDQRQRDVFDQTRASWRDQFAKESGNRRDTMLQDAKWAISELEPDEARRKEVWSALSFSGMGDHPAIIRLLSSAAGKMRERAATAITLAPQRAAINPADRRYGAPKTS